MSKSNTEENLYYKNVKEASIFFDKTILTLSSAFLGFLFYQLKDLLSIHSLNHINFLAYSIISIGLTIILILISYLLTIEQAKLGYEIENISKEKKLNMILFDNLNKKFYCVGKIIDILNITYFITFIIPIVLCILFYISNLYNYAG
ncbi:MAG: hypothetical protein PHI37_03780 [Candidatus Gracilibacteria bacterium]|nr:hypothetical protein [Candidatus Gracilibacteria bacterium]